MIKKSGPPLQPIDPDAITDISDARKESLISQGLRPYRSEGGKVKWLNLEQVAYKLSKNIHKPIRTPFSFHKIHRGGHRRRRKHSHRARRFWRRVGFYALIAVLFFLIIFLFKNNFFML